MINISENYFTYSTFCWINVGLDIVEMGECCIFVFHPNQS